MAVEGFTARFAGPLGRARLLAGTRVAAEADPLPASDALNDKPVPIEHTTPETVSPDEPEEGKESYEHEVKQVDPTHFEPGSDRSAALHDELAQPEQAGASPQDPAQAGPGAEPPPPPAVPTPQANPDGAPGSPGAAVPEPQGDPSSSPSPDMPAPGGAAPPEQPADNSKPIFDFENGLDPASKGQLVNDWQTNVDSKLFSRHTNVVGIEPKGNAVTFLVQAFNTDTGAKPDVSTGYASDGLERGELMSHLREIFQPTGPAIGHISGVYNDFIEQQADQGAMPLMRVKPAGSFFQFQPQDRKIEGWSDTGLGRDPIWRATPYTVYTVALTIQFAAIGGQGG